MFFLSLKNSDSETSDSSDASSPPEKAKSHSSHSRKKGKSERSKHHKSRRSRTPSRRRSSRSRRKRSRNRSKSRSRSARKDSSRRHSSRSSHHRRHRKKRSRSSKDNHLKRSSHKVDRLESRREREVNNSKEPITRATKLEEKPVDKVEQNNSVVVSDICVGRPKKLLFKRNEEIAKKTEQLTGIKIPSYLNTTVLNPLKYAETEQKRKLLWSKKDDSKKLNILAWNASSVIASRGDDRKAAKFRKLMGIHDEPNVITHSIQDVSRKEHEQAVLFSRLDADYQSARSQTHTSRGVGLGYNQSAYIDPSAYLAGRREEN